MTEDQAPQDQSISALFWRHLTTLSTYQAYYANHTAFYESSFNAQSKERDSIEPINDQDKRELLKLVQEIRVESQLSYTWLKNIESSTGLKFSFDKDLIKEYPQFKDCSTLLSLKKLLFDGVLINSAALEFYVLSLNMFASSKVALNPLLTSVDKNLDTYSKSFILPPSTEGQ